MRINLIHAVLSIRDVGEFRLVKSLNNYQLLTSPIPYLIPWLKKYI